MNKINLVLLFTFILTIFSVAFSVPGMVHAQQNAGVYYGAYTDNSLSSFESDAGKPVSLVMLFHSWNEGGFPTGDMDSIRSHGAIPVISWQSYDPNNTGTSWQNIAGGSMDAYITQWAHDSKSWGHPYFLRFNWEMNGYWDPYASQADSYVAMWKHVHDIFTQNGVTNVTWVWCPNIDGYATRPFDSMYPGGDYVDWVCMDGYNFGTSQAGESWESFSSLFAPTYNHLLRLAPGKPIMIGETSSAEQGGSKADWISDMLVKQLPSNFPNVKAFIWFNINKEADWRIESSDNVKLTFAQGIASSYYASNNFGAISSSPIPYLGSFSSQAVAYTKPEATSTLVSATPTLTMQPSIIISPTPQFTPIPPKSPMLSSQSSKIKWAALGILLFGGVLLLISKRRNKWKKFVRIFKKV